MWWRSTRARRATRKSQPKGTTMNGAARTSGRPSSNCALNALSVVKGEVGSLDRVRRIVKLTGFLASAAGFTDQPKVVDGASTLLAELFGEKGQHARAAVGVNELPLGSAVEVEMIVEVEEQ